MMRTTHPGEGGNEHEETCNGPWRTELIIFHEHVYIHSGEAEGGGEELLEIDDSLSARRTETS